MVIPTITFHPEPLEVVYYWEPMRKNKKKKDKKNRNEK